MKILIFQLPHETFLIIVSFVFLLHCRLCFWLLRTFKTSHRLLNEKKTRRGILIKFNRDWKPFNFSSVFISRRRPLIEVVTVGIFPLYVVFFSFLRRRNIGNSMKWNKDREKTARKFPSKFDFVNAMLSKLFLSPAVLFGFFNFYCSFLLRQTEKRKTMKIENSFICLIKV